MNSFSHFLQQALIDKLATFGHKMMRFDNRGAVVCAISKNATGVYANADHRKAGGVDGLWNPEVTTWKCSVSFKFQYLY